MSAITWANYGVLVALAGGLLAAVFVAVTRVDALRDRMDAGFDRVEDRFSHVDEQIDGVRRDIRDLDQRVTRAGG